MAKYMYHINYPDYEEDLCDLEMRTLFNRSIEGKVFFSHQRIDESISPYIKSRLEILHVTNNFDDLVQKVIANKYSVEGGKVEYLPVVKRDLLEKDRNMISKSVGLVMEGFPSFDEPEFIFGVTFYEEQWYFGLAVYNTLLWKKHRFRPCSYSSSLGINIAKAIVNIAAGGDISKKVIDPCCGVGTVLLEGHYSGYDITGCEINEKVADKALKNLKYYGYQGQVIQGDIKDIKETYDVSVVDLPYDNFCQSNEENIIDIIHHAARISKRQVFISAIDLREKILEEGLMIVDSSVAYKSTSRNFSRYIWVCETVVGK